MKSTLPEKARLLKQLKNGQFNIPDFIYGRLSADTIFDVRAMVDKILIYEKDPTFDSSFYSKITAASYFQDENRLFLVAIKNHNQLFMKSQIRNIR